MQVLLIMAGNGSRFTQEGIKKPKPLLPIPYGKNVEILPLYQSVLNNVIDIFSSMTKINKIIIIKRDSINVNFKYKDTEIKTIDVKEVTEGALCTALLAKEELKLHDDLLIINSDQLIEIDKINFKTFFFKYGEEFNFLFTFQPEDESNKWSFAKLHHVNNSVVEIAEKNKISELATCGLYYFKDSYTFLNAADEVIKANDRFNNEFYLAPIYNYCNIGQTLVFNVSKMIGLGTPEDYNKYLFNNGFALGDDEELVEI